MLKTLAFFSKKNEICWYIKNEKQNYKNENVERKYLKIKNRIRIGPFELEKDCKEFNCIELRDRVLKTNNKINLV